MVSAFKKRLRHALSAQRSPAVPAATFYATKYAREDYGTAEQLAAGYRDNASSEPTPPAVLDRLIAAWRAMQREAEHSPPAYQVGGEWKSIIEQAFEPLTSALDAGDRVALDEV